MQKQKGRRGGTKRFPDSDVRCAYCGKDMRLDIRVGGELCCKACEDFMREKKILDKMGGNDGY